MTAQRDPTAMPTRMMTVRCSGAGSDSSEATCAAMMEARRYWPSTPMLKRFMRKPMATATADRYSGVARLTMSTSVSNSKPKANIRP